MLEKLIAAGEVKPDEEVVVFNTRVGVMAVNTFGVPSAVAG